MPKTSLNSILPIITDSTVLQNSLQPAEYFDKQLCHHYPAKPPNPPRRILTGGFRLSQEIAWVNTYICIYRRSGMGIRTWIRHKLLSSSAGALFPPHLTYPCTSAADHQPCTTPTMTIPTLTSRWNFTIIIACISPPETRIISTFRHFRIQIPSQPILQQLIPLTSTHPSSLTTPIRYAGTIFHNYSTWLLSPTSLSLKS